MSTVTVFPRTKSVSFSPARLLTDERRVLDWFDSLCDADRKRSYAIAEIKAAVGVPATRLRIALYRLEWKRERDREFGLAMYRGPFHKNRESDMDDVDRIIREVQALL
jgi:hypothetical protein